jgi:hypothetical protein
VISPIESSARADVVEDAAAPKDEVAASDGDDDFGCVIRVHAARHCHHHPHTERVCTAAL